MASSPRSSMEKKHWWLTNRKVVDKCIREARALMATHDPSDVSLALNFLNEALSISPRNETALELKARSLLFLRRFRDVANMLQDYIPSYRPSSSSCDIDDTSFTSLSSDSSSGSLKERIKLLSSDGNGDGDDKSFRCFSVSKLKRRILAGVCKNADKEGQWRYMVLGQACCHLGMMEDAMVLLQTFRRLATAAFRRESLDLHDDDFSNMSIPLSATTISPSSQSIETATILLNQIKLLLRRKAAAVASLDAGLPTESIRHYSKILDSKRGTPQAFVSTCLIGRAAAYRAAGRLAESIADCNRALALDPTSISALRARVDVLESIRSFPDCLRDLDHLKLLYDAVLRDRKLPGPAWKPHHDIRYSEIAGCLRALMVKIQETRKRMVGGEGNWVDYHALIGVSMGCKRSELERAHLLLLLKHRPEKAAAFVDRVEFADEHRDVDTVRDQARMSALVLYRMLQKGYSSIMSTIINEEKASTANATAPAAATAATTPVVATATLPPPQPVYQGVFCRDLATVGSLLSQANYGRAINVKYEALSC